MSEDMSSISSYIAVSKINGLSQRRGNYFGARSVYQCVKGTKPRIPLKSEAGVSLNSTKTRYEETDLKLNYGK